MEDAFIAKFSSSGSRIWSTYYGGNQTDWANGITCDASGNVYITGFATSTANIATTGAFQEKYTKDSGDAFIAKFNSLGKRQLATYFGGTYLDYGNDITCDESGNVIIVGHTMSISNIASSGAHQAKIGNSKYEDAFIAKFNASGKRLWSTYYGGENIDIGIELICDSEENIYFTGHTNSSYNIATVGALQSSHANTYKPDAFIVKFNNSGKRQWATYFGGFHEEYGIGITIGQDYSIYVAGSTESDSGISTTSAHQTSHAGSCFGCGEYEDGFILSIKALGDVALDSLIYVPSGICLDDSFKVGAILNNPFEQQVSNTKITMTITGPDSITISDSMGVLTGTTKHLWQIGNWFHFTKPGTYKLISYLSSKDDDPSNDTFVTSFNVYQYAVPAFKVATNCNDSILSFENLSSSCRDNITYFWDFGDGDTSTSIAPKKAYHKPGNYIVKLVVSNRSGKDSISYNIKYQPERTINFKANVLCNVNEVTFINKSVDSSASIITYHWDFGDGDTSTLKNPVYTYTTAGKYKVILVATTDKGCIDSVSDSITIFPLPTADFEPSNICQSDEATFTSKSLLATEWYWNFGDSTTSTSENPTNKYFSAGTYMVKLKVKNINGCMDSISKQIEVYEMPEAIFSVSNICVSDSFSLTDSSKGATNWFWDFGDGYTATLQHPKHKYEKAGTYTIYLTSTNSNGCSDILSKQIEVYDIPKANFSAIDICITDSLQIIDSSQNATNYVWNFGDNSTSTVQYPRHKYKSAGTYTISLTVSNNNGCKDSISRTVKVDSTCVWPGDANADKIADNKDILYIGLAYSDTGSNRTDTSTLWKGNIVKDWSSNFSSGANYKHADSDGNGKVSHVDTLAVTRNYTKTHSKKQNINRGKNTDPVFKIEIQNDSLKAGDTLLAYILLGENALPAKDVYGLAFSLNYNRDIFSSPEIDFSGSWLGNNILSYSNNSNGLDIAITRIDQQNISGSGMIAAARFIVRKDAEIDTKQLKLEITDNLLISADEQE
ncbi:MAG: PKD domain-containing protein, partial [Bacteroidia bacterium]